MGNIGNRCAGFIQILTPTYDGETGTVDDGDISLCSRFVGSLAGAYEIRNVLLRGEF